MSLLSLVFSVFRNLSFFDLYVLEETLKCVYCDGRYDYSEYGIKCGNTTRVVSVPIWSEVMSDP